MLRSVAVAFTCLFATHALADSIPVVGLPVVDVTALPFPDAFQFAATATVTRYSDMTDFTYENGRFHAGQLKWGPEPRGARDHDLVTGPHVEYGIFLGVCKHKPLPAGVAGTIFPRCGYCTEAGERERESLRLGFHPEALPVEGAGFDVGVFFTLIDEIAGRDRFFRTVAVRARLPSGAWSPYHMIREPGAMVGGLPPQPLLAPPMPARWPPYFVAYVELDLADLGVPVGAAVPELEFAVGCGFTTHGRGQFQDAALMAGVHGAAARLRRCAVDSDCPSPDDCTEVSCERERCEYRPVPRGRGCGAAPGGVCDGLPRPSCVQCLEDDDCASRRPETPWCARVVDTSTVTRCVACLADDHCPQPDNDCLDRSCAAHACEPAPKARGVGCEAGYCDGEAAAACLPCLEDAHCAAPVPACDLKQNRCVPCTQDAHCVPTDACLQDGICLPNQTCAFNEVPGCGEEKGEVHEEDKPQVPAVDPPDERPGRLRADSCACVTTDAPHPSATAWFALLLALWGIGRRRHSGT